MLLIGKRTIGSNVDRLARLGGLGRIETQAVTAEVIGSTRKQNAGITDRELQWYPARVAMFPWRRAHGTLLGPAVSWLERRMAFRSKQWRKLVLAVAISLLAAAGRQWPVGDMPPVNKV
jgi:hypothetical protein